VNLHAKTRASFLSSGRMLCRLDGSIMAVCPYTNPEKFIDTSCMMFARDAFHVLANWGLMPSYAHIIGDRVMLHYVKAAAVRRAHSDAASVYYRCGKEGVRRAARRPRFCDLWKQLAKDVPLPLGPELRFISKIFCRAHVFIDDFQVPGRPWFGFDAYPNGRIVLNTLSTFAGAARRARTSI
jgi:hypothetical protein